MNVEKIREVLEQALTDLNHNNKWFTESVVSQPPEVGRSRAENLAWRLITYAQIIKGASGR